MAQTGRKYAASSGNSTSINDRPSSQIIWDSERTEVIYETEHVQLRKSITFTGAVAILLGNVGGASIFIAPTTILSLTGSPGLAVLIWLIGGIVTLTIAFSVCELALRLPGAGGPYNYALEVFGEIPGFVVLWGFVLLIGFPSWALAAYTGSLYTLTLVYQDCPPPESVVRLMAAWLLVGLVAVNCTYTKYVTRLQSLFTISKAAALLIIVVAGLTSIRFSEASRMNLEQMFEGSTHSFGRISLSLFASYFSYGGWQIITMLLEEVQGDPVKVVPKALGVSFGVAILGFVLTNFAYYVVLTPLEVLESDAVAMTFGRQLHVSLPYVLATVVALCCIGSINIVVMGQPRILYAAACRGHMPRLFAMLQGKFMTPWPATFFMFLGALYMLLSGTVSMLINYISLYVCIMLLVLLLALIYLRCCPHQEALLAKQRGSQGKTQLDFKVPMPVLVVQAVLTLGLIVMSVVEKPRELGVCLALLAGALPVYLLFIHWPKRHKPRAFHRFLDHVTSIVQKTFLLELPSALRHEDR